MELHVAPLLSYWAGVSYLASYGHIGPGAHGIWPLVLMAQGDVAKMAMECIAEPLMAHGLWLGAHGIWHGVLGRRLVS